MRLPVYVITYRCRKCGTPYSGEWNPNDAGHVEPATACPSCGSPVRLFLGMAQKYEAVRVAVDSEPLAPIAARQNAA